MSMDHKSEGEKMQLMIQMMSHLPVKKRMSMMMKTNKVLLPKYNCSDKRSPRISYSETTGKSETVTLKSPHHYSLPLGHLHTPVPF